MSEPLSDARRAVLVKRIAALQKAAKAPSIRVLIDVILTVTGQPKRKVITDAMDAQIRSLTLVDRKTAAEIAAILDVSVPTVAAARRRLGLIRKREKPLDIADKPAMLSGGEG